MAFYKLFKVYHLLLIIGTIMAEKKILTDMERIEKNRQIAESYYAVYSKKTVKDGAVYDKWVFAPHATYWSPYFGNNKIDLGINPVSVKDSATLEALSYSVEFKDWGPVDFECFPSIEGVAWKTHFGLIDKKMMYLWISFLIVI